jgi:hypothetical protein
MLTILGASLTMLLLLNDASAYKPITGHIV